MQDTTPIFTLTLTITQEDIDSVLSAAFEGGINYWCESADQIAANVVLDKEDLDKHTFYADEAGNFEYALSDAETGKLFRGMYTGIYQDKTTKGSYRNLTLAALREGMELYVDEAQAGWRSLVLPSDSSFDAGNADAIIQLAVFGSVVFG